MTKTILLTADDFGLNSSVSQAIVQLAQKEKLSAASCITNLPDWDGHLAKLIECRPRIKIGLHFNLTEGNWLSNNNSMPTLFQLIQKIYLQQITIDSITKELQSQIDQFTQKSGFLPDYIDGHQHIQHLPIIRQALATTIAVRWQEKIKPYVRVSSCNSFHQFLQPKALLIHLLGANALIKQLKKYSIPYNTTFAGIYSLKPQANYAILFENFLQQLNSNGILMCHPGLPNNHSNADPLAKTRAAEFNFIASPQFTQLLETHNISLDSRLTKLFKMRSS